MLPVLRNGHPVAPAWHRPANRLSSAFGRLFDAPIPAAAPLCVWQDEEWVYAEADVPGVASEDLDLSVHDGEVIIRGERKGDGPRCGRFEYRAALPADIQADKADATLRDGVLSLKMPKAEEARPRRITLRKE